MTHTSSGCLLNEFFHLGHHQFRVVVHSVMQVTPVDVFGQITFLLTLPLVRKIVLQVQPRSVGNKIIGGNFKVVRVIGQFGGLFQKKKIKIRKSQVYK